MSATLPLREFCMGDKVAKKSAAVIFLLKLSFETGGWGLLTNLFFRPPTSSIRHSSLAFGSNKIRAKTRKSVILGQ
jgi:hypothetical protein